ncbi:MAG: YeeE/YedE family protein [Novosphingobium sp.]|nr:YeeE/YedE family protein [Novosphingobium sp.]
MRAHLITLLSGTLFGVGLALSGMMNPARVRGFLDILGNWDPTLVFVMGGAVVAMALAWLLQARMQRPIACDEFSLPGTTRIDSKLLGGGVLFGIGWGLAGLCPGPAIASLATNPGNVIVFIAAMVAGMTLFSFTERNS